MIFSQREERGRGVVITHNIQIFVGKWPTVKKRERRNDGGRQKLEISRPLIFGAYVSKQEKAPNSSCFIILYKTI